MKTNDFNLKNPFAIIIAILFITDITILADIPVLRQIFAFLCFTFLPGLLILYVLKPKIGILKEFVLAVGLSVSFLIFFGLLINSLYPLAGIARPLSTLSLVISLNIALIFLCVVGYKRNSFREDFYSKGIRSIKEIYSSALKDNSLISPLLFPLLFPFLSVFGTYLMNTEGNNIILMLMLFAIPIYVVFVVFLNKRIPKIVYPVAVLMISISLLLMHGLRSSYVNGADVHNEFYAFQIVAENAIWSMANHHHVLTACLSTSLLPAIYQGLMNMNGQYIYKLVFQLIFAITPLAVYVLSRKYVNELYAFIAALFFTSQSNFFYVIQSAMRTEIALLFFALAMMVLLDDEMDILSKNSLFLIFMFSVVVSHYTVAYIFFFLILFVWLIITPLKEFFKSKNTMIFGAAGLLGASIFFWYAQVTETSFAYSSTVFVTNTLANMAEWFVDEIKTVETVTTLGAQREVIEQTPDWIMSTKNIICTIANGLVSIGVIGTIVMYIRYKEGEIEHLLLTVLCWVLMVLFVVMPFAYSYELGRLYMQTLVLLALSFVMGGEFVSKCAYKAFYRIKRFKADCGNTKRIQDASISKYTLLIIMLVLIPYFACSTYLYYQVLGVPYSEDLNTHGWDHSRLYISEGDVVSARWLVGHKSDGLDTIYCDIYGALTLGMTLRKANISAIVRTIVNRPIGAYLYLRNANVIEGVIFTIYGKAKMSECVYLFDGMNKIYGNGISEVWV